MFSARSAWVRNRIDTAGVMTRLPVRRAPKSVVVSKEEIGRRLRVLRERRGVSQKEMAALLGTNQSHVSNVERGDRGITIQQLVKIARALKASTDDILGEKQASDDNGFVRDRRLIERMKKIERLPAKDKQVLLKTVDAFLKGSGVA